MRVIDDTNSPAAALTHMAQDAKLLETSELTLRHYLWAEDSYTIGRITPIPPASRDQNITRRPTGGGLVHHHPDTSQTYALAIPSNLFKLHFSSITHFYQQLHYALQALFPENSTHLYDPTRSKQGSICFQHYSPHDLIDSRTGNKLAGAAIRRTKATLLIQGEIKWHSKQLGLFPKDHCYKAFSFLTEYF